jgi:DNA-binding beta-propeller fold protein YncE
MACASASPGPAGGGIAIPGYRVVRDVPLPGGASRWEYQLLDGASHRLYLAHRGANELVVVDTARQRVTGTLPGVPAARGLAFAPELNRLYATAGGTDQVVVLDAPSLRVLDRVPAGAHPDDVAYVSDTGRVFVSNEDGPGDTVIDGRTNSPLAGVALGGAVGESQYDPWNGLVLVTVRATRELVGIDTRTLQVAQRHRLPGCDEPDGIAVDAMTQDRVFVACEGNARLLTLDLAAGAVAGAVEVGASPDILALDPSRQRLYVAAASGVLTVVDTAPAVPRVIAGGYVGRDAHSVLVDPDTHVVYLPVVDASGKPVLRELAPD